MNSEMTIMTTATASPENVTAPARSLFDLEFEYLQLELSDGVQNAANNNNNNKNNNSISNNPTNENNLQNGN